MRLPIDLAKLWMDEFTGSAGLCTLCANTGWIPKRVLTAPDGTTIEGPRQPCICPNGRMMKKERP
jgi:hypothetical protein